MKRTPGPVRTLAGMLVATAAIAALCASGRIGSQPQRPAPRPNIVFILADDLGYGDLSAYGHPTIRTPRLDALAAEGVRLTSFYAAAPACTPSRVAYLTGRYPIRTGLNGVVMPDDTAGLPPSEVTVAGALKAVGYRTGIVGKWHLGHQPDQLPADHGFDEYFGLPYSNDMVPPWVQTTRPLRLMRGRDELTGPVDVAALTSRYTDEAVRFIRAHQAEPFFLYVAHSMPHVPLGASPRFAGRSPAGRYGDVISEIDWSTGQILDTLADLRLDARTLVVFTSDNGPWLNMPPRMLVDDRVVPPDAGSPGPLRGAKATTWEGGVRVPFLARWPGQIPAGQVRADLAAGMDLAVTLATLGGGAFPSDRTIDGASLWPLLSGSGTFARDTFFYLNGKRLDGVRDPRWKLRVNADGAAPRLELYDLLSDPSERYDAAAAHPDVVKRLADRAVAFARETGATASDLFDRARRDAR